MRRSRWLVAASAVGLLAVHMVLLASALPVVRHLTVHARDWPAGTAPIKLVLLSDLHVATPGDSVANLTDTVARVNDLHPDLVMIAGDFVSNGALLTRSTGTADAIAPLAALRARLGVIAVYGNHDFATGTAVGVATALARAHVTLLDNETVRRGPLAVLGLSDITTGHDREASVLAEAAALGGIPVALTHNPDAFVKLPLTIPLVLAGHTHCGQVTAPLIGPIALTLKSGHRYACGIVRDGDRTAVITAGLGASNLPIRLGAAPDFWVIDIGA